MGDQFKGKKVPWKQMEEYLTVHQGTIVAYLDLLKHKVMDQSTIETLLPNSFWKIHEVVSKIIEENDINPNG
jgi:hypothetical protein